MAQIYRCDLCEYEVGDRVQTSFVYQYRPIPRPPGDPNRHHEANEKHLCQNCLARVQTVLKDEPAD